MVRLLSIEEGGSATGVLSHRQQPRSDLWWARACAL